LALTLLALLTRRHVAGERPLAVQELAIEVNLPVSLVEEQVDHLVEDGLLGLMSKPEGVSLMKPPELISLKEVLDAVRDGNAADARIPLHDGDPILDVLRRRDEAVEQALSGQTLRSLVIEGRQGTREEPVAFGTPETSFHR
jgi:membrane protein